MPAGNVEQAEDYPATVGAQKIVEIAAELLALHHARNVGSREFGKLGGGGRGGGLLALGAKFHEFAMIAEMVVNTKILRRC